MKLVGLVVAAAGLAASAPAHADRATFVSLDGALTVRVPPRTDMFWGGTEQPDVQGGGRIRLSFEDAPRPIPLQNGRNAVHAVLVPELIGGFMADSTKAEAVVGAGLRGDLQVAARGRRGYPIGIRLGVYLAARGEVIGENHDPAGEFVMGEYFFVHKDVVRIGFEGGVYVRRSAAIDMPSETVTPFGAIVDFYVAWRL